MKLKTAERVRAKWDEIEAAEPDISTERLIAMTGDALVLDASQVVEALRMTQETAQ